MVKYIHNSEDDSVDVMINNDYVNFICIFNIKKIDVDDFIVSGVDIEIETINNNSDLDEYYLSIYEQECKKIAQYLFDNNELTFHLNEKV